MDQFNLNKELLQFYLTRERKIELLEIIKEEYKYHWKRFMKIRSQPMPRKIRTLVMRHYHEGPILDELDKLSQQRKQVEKTKTIKK